MPIGGLADQLRPEQGTPLEIERLVRLELDEPRDLRPSGRIVQAGQIDHGERDRRVGANGLVLRIGVKDRAESGVALHEPGQRLRKRGDGERAGEADGETLVVGAGRLRSHGAGGPHLLLRFGEGKRRGLSALAEGVEVNRGERAAHVRTSAHGPPSAAIAASKPVPAG